MMTGQRTSATHTSLLDREDRAYRWIWDLGRFIVRTPRLSW